VGPELLTVVAYNVSCESSSINVKQLRRAHLIQVP